MRCFFNNKTKKQKKMAETRKSIIDEAFMEAESIDKAFKANAKEILAQTMSSEIEEMVKESLEEGWSGLKEDEDEESVELELDDDSELAGLSAGDDLDLELGDEEEDDLDLDFDLDSEEEDEFDVVDLTSVGDEEVISVFKKMSPEDEIEVVQDGGNIDIKDNATGAEYRIELGGSSEIEDEFEDEDEIEDEDEFEDMMDDMEEGVIYEIELDEEDMMDEIGAASAHGGEHEGMKREFCKNNPNHKDCQEMEEGRMPRTLGKAAQLPNRKSADINSNREKMGMGESRTPRNSSLINENKVLKNTISSIKSENETLKEDYNRMVDALKEFREKLNEVAVFNSNLTYTVRLFTEHSTTKDEKIDIIKRFDDAKSLKESKNIYKNLVKEISKTKAPIKESIENKINQTKSSGSATQITESKVYVNPEFEKMKQLWSYDYKK